MMMGSAFDLYLERTLQDSKREAVGGLSGEPEAEVGVRLLDLL